jgi:hypothetical protein
MLDGRYTVAVRRIRPYRGEFTITEGDRVLLRKEVGLAFDALFGPAVEDVADWEAQALRFVDGGADSEPSGGRHLVQLNTVRSKASNNPPPPASTSPDRTSGRCNKAI